MQKHQVKKFGLRHSRQLRSARNDWQKAAMEHASFRPFGLRARQQSDLRARAWALAQHDLKNQRH
jgi:hypothetical protein